MPDQAPPPAVPKLDAVGILRQLRIEAGIDLELVGLARGGEVGAAFVRWPDGREGVLSRGSDNVETLRRTAEILELARRRSIPCPRYDLIQELPGDVAVVQERLPGVPPRRVDDRLISEMVALNDRFADLLADRPDVPLLDLYLTESGPGFCLHESLERYDQRTLRLLGWIREVGMLPTSVMRGTDLVHADFHPGNVLVNDSAAITGIIDWDGVGRGDRQFGLVTLAFDLGWGRRFSAAYRELTSDGVDQVTSRLPELDSDVLRAYWAHMSLRLADWAIRHHTTEVVDHHLDFAMTGIGRSLLS